MSDETKPRKIAFNLYPEEQAGDRLASELLDNIRLKERGRAMRAFLLTGAAMATIDSRLPYLIAELATKDVTFQDIQYVISSVIPNAFSPDIEMIQSVMASLNTSPPKVPEPAQKAEEETRNNAQRMFLDDD